MFKFFRKIRNDLMKQNKTSKPALPAGRYFKYAIGEIILVVIGILIALQINNWNQNRLERNEEQIILSNLKDDFTSAIEEFKSLNALRNDFISAAKVIIGIEVNTIDTYPTIYLDNLFSKTLTTPTFNNESGSLNVLLTSGKINLITNQVLKKKLIAWPGDVADMTEDEIRHRDIINSEYDSIIRQYLSWNDLIKVWTRQGVVRFNDLSLKGMPDNPIVQSDYKTILNDKSFLNLLNQRATLFTITNSETLDLIKKAEEIIDIIEQELK